MSSAITIAGQTRINQLRGAEQPLIIDRMILALIPGLDPTQDVDRSQQMPDPENIVYTYDIEDGHKGYVNPDQVVYSMILGSNEGNFSFNWIGTVEKDTNTIITVTSTPETPKRKTDLATNTTGNNITRNVMMAFQDAHALTGVTVSAETWQFDYQGQVAEVLNEHEEKTLDPTDTDTIKNRHMSNAQGKKWEDHLSDEKAHGGSFEAPTCMLFNQPTAPVGWTKKTDWADNASLMVGNTFGDGGSDSPIAWTTKINIDDHAPHKHSGVSHIHPGSIHNHKWADYTGESSHDKTYDSEGIPVNLSWTKNSYMGINVAVIYDESALSFDGYTNNASGSTGEGGEGDTSSGGPTTHTVSQSTYTPKYQIIIAATKD